jgi:hypothetical protein
MPKTTSELRITPGMTVLDVVSNFHPAVEVFRRYDNLTGACIYCNHLFETVADVAHCFGLNLAMLLGALETAARSGMRAPE